MKRLRLTHTDTADQPFDSLHVDKSGNEIDRLFAMRRSTDSASSRQNPGVRNWPPKRLQLQLRYQLFFRSGRWAGNTWRIHDFAARILLGSCHTSHSSFSIFNVDCEATTTDELQLALECPHAHDCIRRVLAKRDATHQSIALFRLTPRQQDLCRHRCNREPRV